MQLVCDKGGCSQLTTCCVGFLNGFCPNGAAGQAKFLQLNCGGTLDAWGFQRHDLGVALWGRWPFVVCVGGGSAAHVGLLDIAS